MEKGTITDPVLWMCGIGIIYFGWVIVSTIREWRRRNRGEW